MKKIHYISLIVAVMLSMSCRNQTPEMNSPTVSQTVENWVDVFDYFWETTSSTYMFWDVTDLDWDEVRNEYRPKFEELSLSTIKGDSLALVYFTEMVTPFVDHHYVLTLNGSNIISPSKIRNQQRDDYHASFDRSILYRVLSEDMADRVESLKYFSATNTALYSALIDGTVAYFSLDSFKIYDKITSESVNAILQNFYNIVGETEGLEGIIIDVRNNPGGYNYDENFVLAPLIEEPLTMYYQRLKNSISPMDYTPWVPIVLSPYNPVNYDHSIPIIALADVNSVSMAELTTMAIKSLPNGLSVGERTWGGHGSIATQYDSFYSGQFSLSPYISVYCATYSTRPTFDGILEGVGVSPDIEVRWDEQQINQGVDVQLETAISYIKGTYQN